MISSWICEIMLQFPKPLSYDLGSILGIKEQITLTDRYVITREKDGNKVIKRRKQTDNSHVSYQVHSP